MFRSHANLNKFNTNFLILNFRRVLNIVYVLLGISPASDCVLPTFRNPLSGPPTKAGCSETTEKHNLTQEKYPKEHIQY
jgi:hypothetical protein